MERPDAMNPTRREFIGLAAGAGIGLACLSGIAAPGSIALADGGDTVIITHSGDPLSWCPSATADDNAYPLVQNMFHRLTKLDASKKAIPDAAESWEASEDGLAITFHLRQDLAWSDGVPLTSADVVYTFQEIRDNPARYLSVSLQGVESFEAPDDYTVVFNLSQPDMSIVTVIGWYAGFILPKHIYDVEGVDWTDNEAAKTTGTPVTSGPYRLAEYRQGQSITLVANEDYYEVPRIKKLVYSIISDPATKVQALLNAETDVLEGVPFSNAETLTADPSLRLVLNRFPSPVRVIFNLDRTDVHLDDVAVRRAIAMCFDRDAISKKAFGGVMPPETSFYPSLYAEYANTEDVAPGYDPEGARRVLEEAGYTADENGNYLTGFVIDTFSSDGYDQCAQLIAAAMTEIGLECSLQISESNAYSAKVNQQRDFAIAVQSGFMGPDPSALKQRVGTGSASNSGNYSNAEFDELCTQANATVDDQERADLYKQAQAILAQDLPYIPVCLGARYDAYAANLVDTPIDGEGRWGWAEWTYASWA